MLAERIAANGPLAVPALRRLIQAAALPEAEGFRLEDATRRAVLAGRDAREGPRAFVEKRRALHGRMRGQR